MENCYVLLWSVSDLLSSVPEVTAPLIVGKNVLTQPEFTFEKRAIGKPGKY